MKRGIIAALVALLSLVSAQAQGPILPGPGLPVAGGCSDTNATSWSAAVVTAGGTVSGTQQTRVCNLIVALKGHSLFAKLDRLWLFASENTFQAKIDIIGVNNFGTITGSPTFTASQGYAGVSNSSFINSNFTPSSSGVAYTLNSASIGIYDRTNRTTGENSSAMFSTDGVHGNAGLQFNAFSFDILTLNDGSSMTLTPQATVQGFWVGSRTASNARAFYKNGNTTPIGSDTVASVSLSTVAFNILGRNNNGTNDQGTNDQIAIVLIGGGLTSADIANLSTDLNNGYMTALGTNVY